MSDFSVFDSILDAVFVVDGGGKVIYCNDAAATFCQTSIRRVAGKALLADLMTVEEPNLLPFTESSRGRSDATPFIETEFRVPKAGRTGKCQMAIRPMEPDRWLFYVRDVSLEESLYAKFRSELSQKEEYARNLEKLVEARTAELRSVNQMLSAILDSLGQGFFTFNAAGDCGATYTKACETTLQGVPGGRKAWEVLGVTAAERTQFLKWSETLFGEFLPFDDLKELGPRVFPHESRHVVLDYFPIRDENASISNVVVVATDKTAEHDAQKALEAERQFAAMIVKYMKNRDQFLRFLASVRGAISDLRKKARTPLSEQDVNACLRALHTLEGEAGTFSLAQLRADARGAQEVLEPYKGGTVPDLARAEWGRSLDSMAAAFDGFLKQHESLFRVPEGEVSRRVEAPIESAREFLADLKALPAAHGLARRFQDLFLRVPVEDRFKYYDGLIQTVAERLGKKVKPLHIEGGAERLFPEPYAGLFASLVHAFRNAVDHGLETPEEREWAGKNPAGEVRVAVSRDGAGWRIEIRDDGRGIDASAIRETLKTRYPDRDFSSQSDENVIQNVCLPGFSTRDAIGEFSGRGVGLDAVREEVVKLGGEIFLTSSVGKGTCVTIRVPELEYETPVLRSA